MTAILAFLFGAMVGSFLNVCIYRMPEGKSVAFPGSHCQVCLKPISWFDNIPIFSYFILRGRCRACKTSFSPQYAVIEAMTGGLFVLFYFYFGLTPQGFIYLAFTLALLVVSAIDIKHRIIPDEISVGGIVVGLVLTAIFPAIHGESERWPALIKAGAGLLVGGGFLYATAAGAEFFLKKEAMGGGDIKLIAMIGVFLGLPGVIWTIFVSSVFGAVIGVYQRMKYGEQYIPFGPFLAAAAVSFPFIGPSAIDWYLHTLGVV